MFTTKGVSVQRTHFDCVVSSHSPEFATEVRDLLLKPPMDDPYDVLKSEIVKHTAVSDYNNSSVVKSSATVSSVP